MDRKIRGGVYLVVDPAMEEKVLLEKVAQALEGGVQVLQIWNHWPVDFTSADKQRLVEEMIKISSPFDVPVLINEAWELLRHTALDGVHFDSIPADYQQIKKEIGRTIISGITCSNDLEVIHWAEEQGFDYVSFCSMFPSSSVDSCEIVRPETIQKAREITQMPLFLSGGITSHNLETFSTLDFNGVAVISGILSADSPKASAILYQNALQNIQ